MRNVEQLLLVLLLPALLTCQGEDYQGQLSRGLEMIYQGAYQDAESYFLAMARRLAHSDDARARLWRARALHQAGEVEHLYLGEPRRAVARLREALKLCKEGKRAFAIQLEIANIFYNRLHDYRNAALEFERLVNQYSDVQDSGPYRYRIAQCYFTLRQFDQARAEARLLLESHKGTRLAADGMLLVANSYYVEGRYREAAEAHAALRRMNPPDDIASRSRFEQGLCFQQLGELARAERAFLDALPHHPRPDIVQVSLRQVREQMKESFGEQEVNKLVDRPAGTATAGKKRKTPQATTKIKKPARNADQARSRTVPATQVAGSLPKAEPGTPEKRKSKATGKPSAVKDTSQRSSGRPKKNGVNNTQGKAEPAALPAAAPPKKTGAATRQKRQGQEQSLNKTDNSKDKSASEPSVGNHSY